MNKMTIDRICNDIGQHLEHRLKMAAQDAADRMNDMDVPYPDAMGTVSCVLFDVLANFIAKSSTMPVATAQKFLGDRVESYRKVDPKWRSTATKRRQP
jgi:hypothetical protein